MANSDWVATFEIFPFFQSLQLKQLKYLKTATGKSNFNKFLMLLRSFQDVFWKEDVQGYPNMDSYFTFHHLGCVWECIEVKQKIQFLPSSQVQGLI